MNEKIYVEPLWKIPCGYKELLSRPFGEKVSLISQTFSEKTIKTTNKLTSLYSAQNKLE